MIDEKQRPEWHNLFSKWEKAEQKMALSALKAAKLLGEKEWLVAELAEAKVQHSIVVNGLLEQIDALKGGET